MTAWKIPAVRLGSGGTGGGTKFLADDQTFTEPSGTPHPDLATHDALGLATDAELATHAGAANPHPGYLTPAEGDAAYDPLGAAAAAQAASQPLDSDLTAIAALTTTVYGRALLELANAAAARTALELGTAALAATGDFDAAGVAAAAVSAHEGAADPHTGYVREADANWIDLTDTGETTLHSHAGGSGLTHPQVLARSLGA